MKEMRGGGGGGGGSHSVSCEVAYRNSYEVLFLKSDLSYCHC